MHGKDLASFTQNAQAKAAAEEVGAVNAHFRAAMVHYVLHARPIAEIDQVIAEHPDLAEANARLDRLYVWEEQ